MYVRLIEAGNAVDTGSRRDGEGRREAAAAEAAAGSTEGDEDEDEEVILPVEVRQPAKKKGEGVYCREVLDPCLVCYICIEVLHCTHNQE